jgi:hypothetical protein
MGTGHIMRCIALAQAWQDNGGDVTFLSYCESPPLRQRILDEGFDFIPIEKPYPDPNDLKKTLSILSNSTNQTNGTNITNQTNSTNQTSDVPKPHAPCPMRFGLSWTAITSLPLTSDRSRKRAIGYWLLTIWLTSTIIAQTWC